MNSILLLDDDASSRQSIPRLLKKQLILAGLHDVKIHCVTGAEPRKVILDYARTSKVILTDSLKPSLIPWNKTAPRGETLTRIEELREGNATAAIFSINSNEPDPKAVRKALDAGIVNGVYDKSLDRKLMARDTINVLLGRNTTSEKALSEQVIVAPSQTLASGEAYVFALTLHGVRGIKDAQTVVFAVPRRQASWTVIIGENGVGKTTLLQYLACMMPAGDDQKVMPTGSGEAWKPWMAANISAHLSPNVEVDMGAQLRFAKDEASWSFVYRRMKDGQVTCEADSWHQERAKALIDRFFLVAYGAGRHVSAQAFSERDPAFDVLPSCHTLFADDKALESPVQWLMGIGYSGEDKLLKIAKDCLIAALPDVTKITIENSVELAEAGKPGKEVLFHTPYGKTPFFALGFGYRVLAAWLVDFLQRLVARYPDSTSPNKESAVVLIDEFDLHMHPAWQTELMNRLGKLFPKTQFIVTAHSPVILKSAPKGAKVVLLRKEKDPKSKLEKVVIHNDPAQVEGWTVDQLLRSRLYNTKPGRLIEYERLLRRETHLLAQDKLTPEEKDELEQLIEKLDYETEEDISKEALALMRTGHMLASRKRKREAAAKLKRTSPRQRKSAAPQRKRKL